DAGAVGAFGIKGTGDNAHRKRRDDQLGQAGAGGHVHLARHQGVVGIGDHLDDTAGRDLLFELGVLAAADYGVAEAGEQTDAGDGGGDVQPFAHDDLL